MIVHKEEIGNLDVTIIETIDNRFHGSIGVRHPNGQITMIFNTFLSDFNNTLNTIDFKLEQLHLQEDINYIVYCGDFDKNTNFELFNTIKDAKSYVRELRNSEDDVTLIETLKSATAESTKEFYPIYAFGERALCGIINVGSQNDND